VVGVNTIKIVATGEQLAFVRAANACFANSFIRFLSLFFQVHSMQAKASDLRFRSTQRAKF
jgi:hypothetical protein